VFSELSRTDAELLVCFGASPPPDDNDRRRFARGSINSAFTRCPESFSALDGAGALEGKRGAYRLARPIDQLKLPATYRRSWLRASIGSHPKSYACCRPPRSSACRKPEEEVRADLDRLQAAEFLFEVGPVISAATIRCIARGTGIVALSPGMRVQVNGREFLTLLDGAA
jgi:hypothetical protein